MSTETSLTCITSPHDPGEVEVNVVVLGMGETLGSVFFIYNFQLTATSHCSG